MKEETKTEKTENPEAKKKSPFGRAQVAMLSVTATVLVFILAFSCYGCSYQPSTPPTEEEAQDMFEGLYNSTWELDTAMGVTALDEMGGLPILQVVIEKKHEENESASTSLIFKERPPVVVELAYKKDYGFSIKSADQVFPVKILYSASKDGKTETLTMIGNESNIHCYYLKK